MMMFIVMKKELLEKMKYMMFLIVEMVQMDYVKSGIIQKQDLKLMAGYVVNLIIKIMLKYQRRNNIEKER